MKKRARQGQARFFKLVFVNLSRLSLLSRLPTFTFFTRQSHGCPYAFANKFHKTLNNTFIRVDTSTRQYFTPIA